MKPEPEELSERSRTLKTLPAKETTLGDLVTGDTDELEELLR